MVLKQGATPAYLANTSLRWPINLLAFAYCQLAIEQGNAEDSLQKVNEILMIE